MSAANDFFDADMGIVWAQPGGPNTPCYPLICHNSDSVDAPLGDASGQLCRGPDGKWFSVLRRQGAPGATTFTIDSYLPKQQAWLQRQVERRCPVTFYAHLHQCGRPDVFLNYDYGERESNGLITSRGKTGLVRGRAEEGAGAADPTVKSFDISAEPMPPEYWKLVGTWLTVAESEAEPLRDVAFCNPQRCSGPCGPVRDVCTDGIVTSDAQTVAVAVSNVYATADGGPTWAIMANLPTWTVVGASATTSLACFQIDRDVTRHLAACGTTGADLEVSFTDDAGVTAWTLVDVLAGAASTDFANHGGALFALDHRHIWLATAEADIYFSDNGGVAGSWVDQVAPAPGVGEVLNAVHFCDENYGWAVGGQPATSSLLYYTVDGGTHWNEVTCGKTDAAATGVATIDRYRAWVVFEDGAAWFTRDGGVSWMQRVLPVTASALGDVQFLNEFDGFTCGVRAIGADKFPIVYRTFNGGQDWEYYQYETKLYAAIEYYGLNALWACDLNHVVVVGEAVGAATTPIVWNLECVRPS